MQIQKLTVTLQDLFHCSMKSFSLTDSTVMPCIWGEHTNGHPKVYYSGSRRNTDNDIGTTGVNKAVLALRYMVIPMNQVYSLDPNQNGQVLPIA